MKPSTLKEKILEYYANDIPADSPEETFDAVKRITANYIRTKQDDRKISRVAKDFIANNTFEEESRDIKRQLQLAEYVDSIVMSRIRESYRDSKDLDLDSFDQLKFKVLIKNMLLHFGYETLFVPPFGSLDIVVHRKDIKIAVTAIKGEPGSTVGVKSIRGIKYIANHYRCEQALLITDIYFDGEAKAEALEIGVTLIDRDKLLPLISDLVDGKKQQDKELLIERDGSLENTIFLEGEIKFPKTKVQVVYVKYFIEEDTSHLIFEGKLCNTGKKPAANITVEISLYNRNNDSIYIKSFVPEKDRLESMEEVTFKFAFTDIPREDWENLCRYQLKLEYKNVYKVTD